MNWLARRDTGGHGYDTLQDKLRSFINYNFEARKAGVFVCGEGRFSCPAARGGAARRDAMRRTGRDEVSGPGAAYRIKVA